MMKKIVLLILLILLTGCLDENIIKVNKTQDGYRSELITTIYKDDADDMDYYFCETDTYCVTRWFDAGNQSETKKINLKTKEVSDYDEKPYQSNDRILYENDEYKIILNTEIKMNDEMTHSISYVEYYYEKNNERHLLVEGISTNYQQEYSYIEAGTYPSYDEFVFMIKENDKISIKRIDDGNLIEIDSIPLKYENYDLYDYYRSQDGFVYRYDNDEEILLIQQNQKSIYKKKLDDGSLLVEFYVSNGYPTLKYENDKKIEYYYGEIDKKLIIQKELDGYKWKEYFLDDDYSYVLTYKKSGDVRLIINGETYDLPNPSKYYRTNDSILYTSRNVDLGEYQTFYLDLATNQTYMLSEAIEMTDISYYEDYYIVRGYGNDDLYSVLKFDELTCTMIELPYTWEFKPQFRFEDKILFVHETQEFISLYILEIE